MAEVSGTLVLKWARRYGSLDVENFDTVDDATSAAYHASEYGDESLSCIEIWDADGHRVMSRREALEAGERVDPLDEPPPPTVAYVELRAPDNEGWAAEAYASREAAEAYAERMGAIIGADRVRVLKPRIINGVPGRPLVPR